MLLFLSRLSQNEVDVFFKMLYDFTRFCTSKYTETTSSDKNDFHFRDHSNQDYLHLLNMHLGWLIYGET